MNEKKKRADEHDPPEWGSCGKNSVVYLNWRVLQLRIRLIDYVVVHEMAHLLAHNHTLNWSRVPRAVAP
jgi:hypothetical protein